MRQLVTLYDDGSSPFKPAIFRVRNLTGKVYDS